MSIAGIELLQIRETIPIAVCCVNNSQFHSTEIKHWATAFWYLYAWIFLLIYLLHIPFLFKAHTLKVNMANSVVHAPNGMSAREIQAWLMATMLPIGNGVQYCWRPTYWTVVQFVMVWLVCKIEKQKTNVT